MAKYCTLCAPMHCTCLLCVFLQQVDPNAKFAHVNQYLPSEVNTDDSIVLEATTISSVEGENVRLSERVSVNAHPKNHVI